MAVIEYDSYKQKLLAMDETLDNLSKALEIEPARHELERLELEAHEDGFWNDLERSQKNQMRSKQLQNKIHRYEKLVSTRDDLLALIDMGSEMDDASLLPELEEGYATLEKEMEEARLTPADRHKHQSAVSSVYRYEPGSWKVWPQTYQLR